MTGEDFQATMKGRRADPTCAFWSDGKWTPGINIIKHKIYDTSDKILY